jgi:hypothetical protein
MPPVSWPIASIFWDWRRQRRGALRGSRRCIHKARNRIKPSPSTIVGRGFDAVFCELVSAGMAQHVGMRLDAEVRRSPARSIMRENPGADSGAPRPETKTKGEGRLS